MDDLKLFEKEYREKRMKYFKKNFAGKSIDEILNIAIKETFTSFAKLYIQTFIIKDCLEIVEENKLKTDKTFLCIKSLCKKFDKILETDFEKLIIKN